MERHGFEISFMIVDCVSLTWTQTFFDTRKIKFLGIILALWRGHQKVKSPHPPEGENNENTKENS